jgi:hypothetical protein
MNLTINMGHNRPSLRTTVTQKGAGEDSEDVRPIWFPYEGYSTNVLYHKVGDPVHLGIVEFFSYYLKYTAKHREKFEAVITIGTLPVAISYNGKYSINGKTLSLNQISGALARVAFSSSTEEDTVKLLTVLMNNVDMPESIAYVLENRIPYHWFDEFERIDVRLNVQQIGKKKFAVELSDSVWGDISQTDLNTFVNSYRKESKRGKWRRLTPSKLYERLIGREPTSSELKLMCAFLKQNRTKDIVERRAKELVAEVCEKFPDNFFYLKLPIGKIVDTTKEITENNNEYLFIKGQNYDWKIRKHSNTASRQSVNTFVWNVRIENCIDEENEYMLDEEGNYITKTTFGWNGPICVDNLSFNGANSIGDQMVSRAFALKNDTIAIKMVGTISSYLTQEDMSEHRLDFAHLLKHDKEALI